MPKLPSKNPNPSHPKPKSTPYNRRGRRGPRRRPRRSLRHRPGTSSLAASSCSPATRRPSSSELSPSSASATLLLATCSFSPAPLRRADPTARGSRTRATNGIPSRDELQMGGMKRRGFSLVEEDPSGEIDNAITNEEESAPEFESDSDFESEETPLDEPSKKAIYNRDGILEKLEDICWPENLEWIHKLTIDHNQEQEVDVNDDIVRELAFYTQALEGTREAFAKLQSFGFPFSRPPDYYAEMVKTDAHMLKVKGRLLDEKKKIEESEERKKAREAKKIAKEVQAQKLKERAKQKKEEIESVKKWRKQRQQSGFGTGKNEEMDFNFDGEKGFERSKKRKHGVSPGDRSGGIGKQGSMGQERNKKKREHRNSKFGYGGRKGLNKQNTAETTDDLRGFNKGDFSTNKRRKR